MPLIKDYETVVNETKKRLMVRSRCARETESVSFEWRIENFSVSDAQEFACMSSPTFTALNVKWHLCLHPNVRGMIQVALIEEDSKWKNISYRISIQDKNNESHFTVGKEGMYSKMKTPEVNSMVKRQDLKREQFLPDDILTICCELTEVKNSFHRVTVPTGKINKKIKDCGYSSFIVSMENLVTDFTAMYREGENCDLVLKAEGQEFPVHKCILGARSTVFAAMFEHDMTEKLNKTVNISDVDATVLDKFLLFLYTGKVEVNFEIAIDLFAIADKYDVKDLRFKCKDYILKNISVDTACDVAVLGDIYSDEDLIEEVKVFMLSNLSAVKSTNQWNALRRSKPDLAFDLLEDVCAHIHIPK